LRPHVDVVVVVAFLEGRLPLRVNVQKSAVASVWGYVADGRSWGTDLERFFDRVNHDVLMSIWHGALATSACHGSSAPS
jgi:hypothetical protein